MRWSLPVCSLISLSSGVSLNWSYIWPMLWFSSCLSNFIHWFKSMNEIDERWVLHAIMNH